MPEYKFRPPVYLWSLWRVQYEVWQLVQHLVEGAGQIALRQQLPGQIGEQARGQLSVAGLAFQGQGHGHGGELVLVRPEVQLLQQHLSGPNTKWTQVKTNGAC